MLQRRRARVQVGVTGKETALSRGQPRSHSVLRRVFLLSSSIKLGFSDVSDSISLSQAVLMRPYRPKQSAGTVCSDSFQYYFEPGEVA